MDRPFVVPRVPPSPRKHGRHGLRSETHARPGVGVDAVNQRGFIGVRAPAERERKYPTRTSVHRT